MDNEKYFALRLMPLCNCRCLRCCWQQALRCAHQRTCSSACLSRCARENSGRHAAHAPQEVCRGPSKCAASEED